MTSFIYFLNNIDKPIIVESWKNNVFSGIIVDTKEKMLLESDVGEWHLNTMFSDPENVNKWHEFHKNNLYYDYDIGKFRNKPCASGNYCWLYADKLKLVHNDGLIELSSI